MNGNFGFSGGNGGELDNRTNAPVSDHIISSRPYGGGGGLLGG